MAATAYCTHLDVTSLTGFVYNESSEPDLSQVKTIIDEISLEIDAVLRSVGYDVPLTDTDDLALVKRYARCGAAYNVWHAGIHGESEPAHVESWKLIYDDFLKRVAKGELDLPGSEVPTEAAAVGSITIKRDDAFAQQAARSEYS